jgi:hypothetical protein
MSVISEPKIHSRDLLQKSRTKRTSKTECTTYSREYSQEASIHAEFTKDPQLGNIILIANLPPTNDANRHANAKA